MTDVTDDERSFTVNRVIETPPKRVFEAFLNPDDLAVWTPPPGFEAEVSRGREVCETLKQKEYVTYQRGWGFSLKGMPE